MIACQVVSPLAFCCTDTKQSSDSQHWSICADQDEGKGHRDLDPLSEKMSDVGSSHRNSRDDESRRSSSQDAGNCGAQGTEVVESPLMQWSEADQRARNEIADAQILDKEKLLRLRQKFLAFFHDGNLSSTTSYTKNGHLPELEQIYKAEGFEGREEWIRFVQEAWPGFDENTGRLNRPDEITGRLNHANGILEDGLVGWGFSYDRYGGLRHIRPLTELAVAKPSLDNNEAQMEDKEDLNQVRDDLVYGQMLCVAQLQFFKDQIAGLP